MADSSSRYKKDGPPPRPKTPSRSAERGLLPDQRNFGRRVEKPDSLTEGQRSGFESMVIDDLGMGTGVEGMAKEPSDESTSPGGIDEKKTIIQAGPENPSLSFGHDRKLPFQAPYSQADVVSPGQKVEIKSQEVVAKLKDARLVLVHSPDSKQAATYRVLGHRLINSAKARIIIVSSAEDGDGKTTCAVNLAMALSECNRARVLLIEGNLRRPSMANLLGMKPPVCFAEQLVSHRENPRLPWVLAQIPSVWLHVAAVDPTRFVRPQIMDGTALEQGILQLRSTGYEYVVIDTPSVLGSADVNLIQDCTDGVLLTVWAGKSTSSALRKAAARLMPGKVLGIAMLEV
ncbi:MAG: CpsD/CapB family tyrosine-protein kinase [Pseudomonadota bacterium]